MKIFLNRYGFVLRILLVWWMSYIMVFLTISNDTNNPLYQEFLLSMKL